MLNKGYVPQGRYRIVSLLGQGGMRTTMEAVDGSAPPIKKAVSGGLEVAVSE